MVAVSLIGSLRAKLDIHRRNTRWALQRLYVTLPFPVKMEYPDFLCIGAPKAATTWLHKRLEQHPDICLPKDKELHFFDTPYDGMPAGGLGYYKPHDLSSRIEWRWYSYQFKRAHGRVKGDITPTYARASEANIEKIAETIPEIKIIYILRNPVERAWSGASYFMHRWHGKDMTHSEDLVDWILSPERIDHGFYTEKIEKWERQLNPNNILYVFYDDISNDSAAVLNRICEFIGLDSDKISKEKDVNQKVNSNYPKVDIPEHIWNALYDVYKDEIESLEVRFKRDLSSWKSM